MLEGLFQPLHLLIVFTVGVTLFNLVAGGMFLTVLIILRLLGIYQPKRP